jgi:hypothetical protein
MRIASFILTTAAIAALAGCGSSSPSQPPVTPPPTTTPTTTMPPAGIVLPPGMVCSPTPPPLYGFHVSVHDYDPSTGRTILDSKPLVINVDGYCAKVGSGGATQKFCDTRPEGAEQRTACDYLMTGISPATGRWGPTWTWDDKPCDGENFTSCANHPSNQFMAIAKTKGKYVACANSEVPLAPGGSACGQNVFK